MLDTALRIVRQAAGELGLPVPNELTANRSAQAQQMLALLNAAGSELVRAYSWEFLRKTASFTTETGKTQYPLPPDFSWMLNRTLREKSNIYEVTGPVSGQVWSYLNTNMGVAPFFNFIIKGRTIQLMPLTSIGAELSYEYYSDLWVLADDGANTPQNEVKQDTDIPQYDKWLLVKLLKVKLWAAKGLDITTLAGEYTAYLDAVKGQDHAAPTMSITPTTRDELVPPIAPQTGYGL